MPTKFKSMSKFNRWIGARVRRKLPWPAEEFIVTIGKKKCKFNTGGEQLVLNTGGKRDLNLFWDKETGRFDGHDELVVGNGIATRLGENGHGQRQRHGAGIGTMALNAVWKGAKYLGKAAASSAASSISRGAAKVGNTIKYIGKSSYDAVKNAGTKVLNKFTGGPAKKPLKSFKPSTLASEKAKWDKIPGYKTTVEGDMLVTRNPAENFEFQRPIELYGSGYITHSNDYCRPLSGTAPGAAWQH